MPLARLQQHRLNQLEAQLQTLNTKISRLRQAYAIEAGVAVKFQLEQEIQQAEQDREDLEQQMDRLERELTQPPEVGQPSPQAYFDYYQTTQPPDGSAFYALGCFYLKLQQYDRAVSAFTTALKLLPKEAEIYYYQALALIGGKRPKSLNLKTIKVIEQAAIMAIQLDDRPAHYYYLLAILRFDYYCLNRLMVPSPNPGELLQRAAQKAYHPEAVELLLQSVILRDQRLLKAIKREKRQTGNEI